MTTRIESVRADDTSLEVTWPDGRSDRFPWLWLRDHCPCPESLHPQTLQRLVDTFALPADLRACEVHLEDGGARVEIVWPPDDHVSRFGADFLRRVAGAEDGGPGKLLWMGANLGDSLPVVEYDTVMADDDGVLAWLETVERTGFCFVDGAPVGRAETRALAERIGYVRQTIFGDLWDFTADLAHGDTAYTNLGIKLHTDGTYTFDPPGLQMFHCLRFDGIGGESVLVDGFRAAQDLELANPAAFEILTRVNVPGQYVEQRVRLSARHPVIELGEQGRVFRVCFNNHDRAPFLLPEPDMTAFYDALRAFAAILEDPAYQLRFTLRPGRVLLFDNWRTLHARTAYTGKRRLAGCYLNREDFESRLRVLRQAGGTAEPAPER